MSKKNIAFILFSNGMGGAEQVVVQLIKNIDKNKFNIYIITNDEMIDYFSEILNSNNILNIGSLYVFSKISFFNRIINKIGRGVDFQKKIIYLRLMSMISFINKNNIKVIHSHLMFDLYAGQLLKAKNKKLNFIYTVHGFLNLDNNLEMKYAITHDEFIDYLKQADYITCVSQLLTNKILEVIPSSLNKCTFITNALDKTELSVVSNIEKDSKNLELLFMGGDKEVKGGLLLLDAIEDLIVNYKIDNFSITILGNINLNGAFYKKIIHNNLISSHINLIGFVKPPKHLEYIKKADILIMPSKSEGMPILFYEGIYLQTIVLASNIPIFNELIDDNISGVIFDLDAKVLSSKLNSIISDKILRKNILEFNKKTTIPFWCEITKKYETIYLKSIGNTND